MPAIDKPGRNQPEPTPKPRSMAAANGATTTPPPNQEEDRSNDLLSPKRSSDD